MVTLEGCTQAITWCIKCHLEKKKPFRCLLFIHIDMNVCKKRKTITHFIAVSESSEGRISIIFYVSMLRIKYNIHK